MTIISVIRNIGSIVLIVVKKLFVKPNSHIQCIIIELFVLLYEYIYSLFNHFVIEIVIGYIIAL